MGYRVWGIEAVQGACCGVNVYYIYILLHRNTCAQHTSFHIYKQGKGLLSAYCMFYV